MVVTNTADETQVRNAVEAAIKDVLGHAIAFTPTVVTLENVQIVGDRLYLMLLIADADGERAFAFEEPVESGSALLKPGRKVASTRSEDARRRC